MLTPEIEQLLLQASAERQQSVPPSELAMGAGAAVGGLAGVGIAQAPHMMGKAIGNIRGTSHMLKPGLRMAGGLTAAIIGGGLGEAMRQQMLNNSPEAALLARYQAGVPAPGDEIRLAEMLKAQYTKMGIG